MECFLSCHYTFVFKMLLKLESLFVIWQHFMAIILDISDYFIVL